MSEKVEYSADERRSFLLSIQNGKRTKKKKAEKLAKVTLRKVRAERRNLRKEEREEVMRKIVRKQSNMGIKALPLFASRTQTLLVAEVDAADPQNVTVSEVKMDEKQ